MTKVGNSKSPAASGNKESQVFGELDKMDESVSAHLCRLLVMQVLPAIVEQDCERFGAGISKIQLTMGEYFASAQSGLYTSTDVERTLCQLREHGATGIGQSSWGPTGFAIFSSETDAYQAVKSVRNHWRCKPELELMICRAKNDQAQVSIEGVEASKRQHMNNRA